MTTEPDAQLTWGIIRYAPGSGTFPADDAAAFDGWYVDRRNALAVAEDWAERHPRWIVGLVRSDLVWFGDGNFTRFANRPITKREFNLSRRSGRMEL